MSEKERRSVVEEKKNVLYYLKKIFERHPRRSLPGLDLKFYCTDECDGCGECYRRCPTGHIKMVEGRPYWNGPCLMCAACSQVCPLGAISYGKPDEGGTKK